MKKLTKIISKMVCNRQKYTHFEGESTRFFTIFGGSMFPNLAGIFSFLSWDICPVYKGQDSRPLGASLHPYYNHLEQITNTSDQIPYICTKLQTCVEDYKHLDQNSHFYYIYYKYFVQITNILTRLETFGLDSKHFSWITRFQTHQVRLYIIDHVVWDL